MKRSEDVVWPHEPARDEQRDVAARLRRVQTEAAKRPTAGLSRRSFGSIRKRDLSVDARKPARFAREFRMFVDEVEKRFSLRLPLIAEP